MKRTKFLAMMLIALSPVAFSSCGGDDDDEGESGTPDTKTSVITTEDGDKLLLTNNGEFSYSYDAAGRLVGVGGRYGDEEFSISYNPFKIIEEDVDGGSISMSFNGSGYISRVVESYNYSGDDGTEKGTTTANYSYDGSGHLVKISMSGSATETDEDGTYNSKGTATITLTWSNGNLTKVTSSSSGIDEGDKFSETSEFVYTYGSNENAYNQFTHAILDGIDDMECMFDFLAFVGWYGKGTAYLPTKVAYSYTEAEEGYNDQSGSNSYNTSYTLNSNGTIRSEKADGSYSYSYSTASSSEANDYAPKYLPAQKKQAKVSPFKRMFRRNK